MENKCINCDGYELSLGQCNIESVKWCEKPIEKTEKKKLKDIE